MHIEPIATDRLIIRPVKTADLHDLLEINGDEAVTRFLPYAAWRSVDDGAAWLARMEALAAAGTAQQLVIERRTDGKVIGTLLLFAYDEPNSRLELGYVLGRAHWRQGLAQAALRAACGHLFQVLGLRRLEAQVDPDNQASSALLLSLGFSLEGRLRQRWVTRGVACDACFYGLLAEEFVCVAGQASPPA